MRLRKYLSGLKAIYWRKSEKIVSKKLLGIELKVIDGTIRKEDYDDCWFYHLACNSEVFFDVGANIGQTSLLANLTKKVKRVVLVDPNPEALIFAAKNLLLNNLASNCSFFSAFATEAIGDDVKFYTVGIGSAGSMYASHAETARRLNNFFYVKTITIDYLMDYYQLVPDFVKVDVEGAENATLRGAVGLATKKKTRFLVEMHVLKELSMEQNGNQILDWTKKTGYKAWFLCNQAELKTGNDISHRGRCHLLLQPSEWPYPEFLMGIAESAPLPN